MLLQRACHHFGSCGGTRVDENHNGFAGCYVAGPSGKSLVVGGIAGFQHHDFAALDENVPYRSHSIEPSARIVAQIDDIAFEPAEDSARPPPLDRPDEVRCGLRVEPAYAKIADIVLGARLNADRTGLQALEHQ